MCVCVCVCVCVRDNLEKAVFSFSYISPGDGTQVSVLKENTFTHGAVSRPLADITRLGTARWECRCQLLQHVFDPSPLRWRQR